MALCCIEWYSWRWMIEEVFRILKKEGFNIEASELKYDRSSRKLCLLMLDTILKLFMMQILLAKHRRLDDQ
jgi:transposase